MWEPPVRFVDEQVRGPYRKWYHEHTFEEMEGGVICRDFVDYSVYGAAIMNSLFVQRDLIRIFAFRRRKLSQFFSANG